MRRSRSGSLRRSADASCARRPAHFSTVFSPAIERKTGWLMAEQAGLDHPNRMQTLIGRSRWEADALRDKVRADVLEALGDPDGVLVVDETGFLKKGTHSVGVARQYSGTAGRIENCQVGVFLTYASRFGQALIDRRLYLPEAWAGDAARRAKASVPEEIAFATKPAIARDLVAAALDAGAPCAFVLADALYGSDSRLRHMLEARGQPYVLAVRSNHNLRFLENWTLVEDRSLHDRRRSRARSLGHPRGRRRCERPAALRLGRGATALDTSGRVRASSADPAPPSQSREARLLPRLLPGPARRSPNSPGAAGLRWTVEECFGRAKDDLGLDHCEARSWRSWHRHVTLVMAAAAFLARLAADLRRTTWDIPRRPRRHPAKRTKRVQTSWPRDLGSRSPAEHGRDPCASRTPRVPAADQGCPPPFAGRAGAADTKRRPCNTATRNLIKCNCNTSRASARLTRTQSPEWRRGEAFEGANRGCDPGRPRERRRRVRGGRRWGWGEVEEGVALMAECGARQQNRTATACSLNSN